MCQFWYSGLWRHVVFWVVTDVSETHNATEPDDGGDMFLRNIGNHLPDYTAS
jgi:hypothetical protein